MRRLWPYSGLGQPITTTEGWAHAGHCCFSRLGKSSSPQGWQFSPLNWQVAEPGTFVQHWPHMTETLAVVNLCRAAW
ncbi:hypothetical protein PSEUDO8BK_10555 [Pseudomonas sp. 8BK]|nr:hypothetical protein PSEUDO8BK_10555 [Pseudomonas sp. 8BK]